MDEDSPQIRRNCILAIRKVGRRQAKELLGFEDDEEFTKLLARAWDECEGLHIAEMLGMSAEIALSSDIQTFLDGLNESG